MATPAQQAARALRTGGVTQFADTQPQVDEGIQTAGFLQKLLQQSAKAAPGTARETLEDGVAGRVAEPITEGIAPEKTTRQATQEAHTWDQATPSWRHPSPQCHPAPYASICDMRALILHTARL